MSDRMTIIPGAKVATLPQAPQFTIENTSGEPLKVAGQDPIPPGEAATYAQQWVRVDQPPPPLRECFDWMADAHMHIFGMKNSPLREGAWTALQAYLSERHAR